MSVQVTILCVDSKPTRLFSFSVLAVMNKLRRLAYKLSELKH